MKRIIISVIVILLFSGCMATEEDISNETITATDNVTSNEIINTASKDTSEIQTEDYNFSQLNSESLVYQGAFLLPDEGENEEDMFSYGGEALCYNAQNDSLFITGHNWYVNVAEINIPEPVVSKDVTDLNKAEIVQSFTDIKGKLFNKWTMEIPRAGLEVVGDNLFFCFGEHYEEDTTLGTHGYTDLKLSEASKVCIVDDSLYSTNDYIFAIPDEFTEAFGGCDLLTGRFRDGGWSGMGPSLFAIASNDIINAENNETIDASAIIKYDDSFDGDDGNTVVDYSHADSWTGGAFISCDAGDAIVFIGTHGYGETWYGFSNGVVYPTSGDEDEEVPEVPDYPHDERGWWNDDFRACIMMYIAEDAVKVYRGELLQYEIQPYAFIDLTDYMIVARDETEMQYLGGAAYDTQNNRLFVMELMADEAKPVVHVFTFN